MSLAFRAGISERDFWGMTANSVITAHIASQQNLTRLAYRTALFQRMQVKHLPKNEDALFVQKAKPKPVQSLQEQWRMARVITQVMGGTVH